jgi:hypothetical protein
MTEPSAAWIFVAGPGHGDGGFDGPWLHVDPPDRELQIVVEMPTK